MNADSGCVWGHNQTQVGFGLKASERRLRLGLGSYLDPHSGWVRAINYTQTQVVFGVKASEHRLRLGLVSYPDSGWVWGHI